MKISFLTLGVYGFLRLRVRDSYVWGLVFLRLGVRDCYPSWLVFLRSRVRDFYVWGLGIFFFGGGGG